MHYPIEEAIDLSDKRKVAGDCDKYMMCGLPIFNHRWFKSRKNAIWLPSKKPAELPDTPQLKLLSKDFNADNKTVRFEFKLSGPPHMSIFVLPLEGVTVLGWPFLLEMLQKPEKYQPPYHIFLTYGKLSTPLKFYFDLKVNGKQKL